MIEPGSLNVLCALVEIHIPESRSLKDKRFIIKGLKQRIRDRFGASIAETDYQDKWQRAQLGIAVVSSNARNVEALLQRIRMYLESDPRIWIVAFHEEWR